MDPLPPSRPQLPHARETLSLPAASSLYRQALGLAPRPVVDPETGLGKWTLKNFKDTIRTGRHMGRGREILPPMPIPMYKNFVDADLEAIFAYLQSIAPLRNRVPEPLSPSSKIPQQ